MTSLTSESADPGQDEHGAGLAERLVRLRGAGAGEGSAAVADRFDPRVVTRQSPTVRPVFVEPDRRDDAAVAATLTAVVARFATGARQQHDWIAEQLLQLKHGAVDATLFTSSAAAAWWRQ